MLLLAASVGLHAAYTQRAQPTPVAPANRARSATLTPQQTLAVFYTESDYDPNTRSWVGRVQKLEASDPEHPHSIVDGVSPSGLAVDSLNRRIYVTDPKAAVLTSCGLDGSDAQSLASNFFGNRMKDGPWGIAVEPALNTVMWSAAGQSAIRRANLDGADVHTVSGGDPAAWSATGPFGIAMCLRPGCAKASADPRVPRISEYADQRGLGRVYWTSWGRIQCYELGTGQVSDVVRGLIDPTALVIDMKYRRLFWTDAKAGKVQCSALDGSRVCDVATGLSSPWGLALGPTHIFWTDRTRGCIQSCCLHTGLVRDVLTGLREPKGLALLNGPSTLGRQPSGRHPARRAAPAGPAIPTHQKLAVRFSSARDGSGTVRPAEPAMLRARADSVPARKTPTVMDIMSRSATALEELQAGTCMQP